MGESTAPETSWDWVIRAAISSSSVLTTPPSRSPCPARYLVADCTTTSAPRASGRCRYGVRKVLSTTTYAPFRWASSATRTMSVTRRVGLAGVSMNTIFTESSKSSSVSSFRSVTKRCPMPRWGSSMVAKR